MELISAVQSKNARQLMSWHQEDLAQKAKVSIQTVRNFEKSDTVLPSTIEKIRYAFEASGIEFLEGDGVKRRDTWCKVYSDSDNCDRFFNDITNTIKLHGDEVLAYISNQEVMMKMSSIPRRSNLERMNALREFADIRCVIQESAARSDFMPDFAFRTVPDSFVAIQQSIFVFGKKYATIHWDSNGRFYIVVVDVAGTAQHYRQNLDDLWQKAVTIERAHKDQKRRSELVSISSY